MIDFNNAAFIKLRPVADKTFAAVLDLDSELELWFSGMGKIKLEFASNANVTEICRMISMHVL